MANLILPRRFTQQPQYPVEIDLRNPLANGLIQCYLPSAPGFNLARYGRLDITGNLVISPTRSGLAYTGNGSSFGTTTSAVPSALPITFGVIAGSPVNTEGPFLSIYKPGEATSYGAFASTNWAGNSFPRYNTEQFTIEDNSVSLASGPVPFICRSASTTDHAIIVGNKKTTSTTTSNALASASTFSLGRVLFSNWSGVTLPNNGTVSLACLWNRALTDAEAFAFNNNPWQIFRRSPQVLYFDTAGGGATTLLPSLFTDGDTFHAATVSVGAVTLTPALFSDGDTFHAATVSQGGAPQTLTPDLYADGDTFYAATVAPGSVTLTPALYADADTFHAATVSAGAVTLTPALFSDGDTFHAATVGRGAVTLTPALVSDGDTFHTHAVVLEGGPQTLSPELVVDGDTFHVATVTPGAVTLTPSLYTDADTFHAAEVAAGFNLQPEAYADPDTFYPATVSGGAVTLAPALFEDGDTFYSATVSNAGLQTLEPGLLTDADTFYVPTVTGGARTIGAARSAGRQLQTGARSNIQTNRR